MSTTKTREKLVDVARQLFAKQGLENTTMNDIAVTSGKGRRTLYTYFKNKKQNMEPEDKLVEIVFTHLNMIKEAVQRNGNLRAEFFRNIIMVEKVRKNFDQTELKLFNAIMTEGVRNGKFEIDSIPLCANILHFSVKGLEIPFIYGRLSQGLPSGMSRGIVQKLIHKALGKPDRQHLNYYL